MSAADDGTNLPENTDDPIGEDHGDSIPTDDHATNAIVQNVRAALFESNDLEDSITAPSMEREQLSTTEHVSSSTVEDGATALDLLESSDKGEVEKVVDANQKETTPKENVSPKVADVPEAVVDSEGEAVDPAGEAVDPAEEAAATTVVVPAEAATVDENMTSEKDFRKQDYDSSKLEPATDVEFG